jgi:hypothetical protein
MERPNVFQSIESRPGKIGPYLGQLFSVPIVVGVFSVPIFALYDRLMRPPLRASVWDISGLLVLFGIGIVLGRLAGRRWDILFPTGIWVWVAPACVCVWDFLQDWLSSNEHAAAFSMSFRSVGAHEGLIRFIGTNPTFSLMGYSLGLYVAARVKRRTLPHRPQGLRSE